MVKSKGGLLGALGKVPQLVELTKNLETRVAHLEKLLLGAVAGKKRGKVVIKRRGKRGKKIAKRLCTVCGRPHYAKGLCLSHYQSAYRKKKLAEAKENQTA